MMMTMQSTQSTPTRPMIERQPALPDGVVTLRWQDGRWVQARQPMVPVYQFSEPAEGAAPVAEARTTAPGEAEATAGRAVRVRLASLVALLTPGRRTAEGASR
jgi:hypothetical protein